MALHKRREGPPRTGLDPDSARDGQQLFDALRKTHGGAEMPHPVIRIGYLRRINPIASHIREELDARLTEVRLTHKGSKFPEDRFHQR